MAERVGLWHKIIRGSGTASSRLHDEKGNRVPLSELRYLPRSVAYATRHRLTGRRPELPWIAWNAMHRLDVLLEPNWRMVEFGSGASTRWYAERVGSLHSVEDDPAWFARVGSLLPSTVRYDLRQPPDYWDLSDYPDGSLDIVVVDGSHRGECVSAAAPKLRDGGWLYLDDTDKGATHNGEEHRRAEQNLRDAVRHRGGQLEVATGLVIGNPVVAQQWTLAQLGS